MKKHLLSYTAILILMSGLVFTGGCSRNDMAIVIIDLGLNSPARAERNILDRALAFFTMSMPVAADTLPEINVDMIRVTVSGPGMADMTKRLTDEEMYAGYVSLEVPAGPARIFRSTCYYMVQGMTYAPNYGGIAKADLPSGETVALNIVMYDIPAVITSGMVSVTRGSFNTGSGTIYYNSMSFSGYLMSNTITEMRIYRAVSDTTMPPSSGGYTHLTTLTDLSYGGTEGWVDYDVVSGQYYFYRFVAYNGPISSVMSDPIIAVIIN